MMKVGVIGLGSIAQKAYLPVFSGMQEAEWVLCTRNAETLKDFQAAYRFRDGVQTVEELISLGIQAAFVHSATESHPEIVEKLLQAGVHVYVDKPIAYTYEEAKRLTELAKAGSLVLMTGFNRRYAPMHAALKQIPGRSYIYMEKNRLIHPDMARRFIFDDFIHVVDTINWLCPERATDFSVSYVMREGLLYQVMIKLDGEGFTAIGTMNRDSGMNEEQLSVIGAGEKVVVRDLNTMVRFRNGEENHEKFGDWEPVLKRRGFEDIVRLFLRQAKGGTPDFSDMESALQSHQLCEEIVNYIEKNETGAVK